MKPNPRKKRPTLAERRLDARRVDYNAMMEAANKGSGLKKRGMSGYHKPGSLQK